MEKWTKSPEQKLLEGDNWCSLSIDRDTFTALGNSKSNFGHITEFTPMNQAIIICF